MGNEADLAKYECMEGDGKTEFADSEMGSDFTIQWGEGFFQELMAARAQMEMHAVEESDGDAELKK